MTSDVRLTTPDLPPINLDALPAEIRLAVDLLSPIEVSIVRMTQVGIAAHKIAEAIGGGWTESRVKRWRQQRGFTSHVQDRSGVTIKAMAEHDYRGGRLRRPPTFEELERDYRGARYDQRNGGQPMAAAPKSGKASV